MRVLHLQTTMTPAGNAAYRLHLAMRRVGIDSFVMTYKPYTKNKYVSNFSGGVNVLKSKAISRLFQKKITKKDLKPDSYSFSTMPLLSKGVSRCEQVRIADVIYLHWICGGFLSLRDIKELADTGKPIFFFMHDMWTFTGGCHHSFACDKYKEGCQNCPMFIRSSRMPHKQSIAKKALFEKYRNLYFVSPSEWMAECARQSYVLKQKPIYAINNIVDETIFKPIEKGTARDILNLPKNKKIVSFGCQATANPFKGWSYLQQAINELDRDDVQIMIFGSDYDEATARQIKYPVSFVGKILDEHVLALINSASDVFVSPSLAESFGLTFLENILCETPVVGFDNTAVPEIVINQQTGYLAINKNAKDLGNGISQLLNNPLKPIYNYSSLELVKTHIRFIEEALSCSPAIR